MQKIVSLRKACLLLPPFGNYIHRLTGDDSLHCRDIEGQRVTGMPGGGHDPAGPSCSQIDLHSLVENKVDFKPPEGYILFADQVPKSIVLGKIKFSIFPVGNVP